MSAGYNEWESDLTSIIEKTNNNLKLLRRMGSGSADARDTSTAPHVHVGGPRVASPGKPPSVHSRYAADDDTGSVGSRGSGAPGPRVRLGSNASSSNLSLTGRRPMAASGGAGGGGLTAAMLQQRGSMSSVGSQRPVVATGPPSIARSASNSSTGGGLTAALLAQRNAAGGGGGSSVSGGANNMTTMSLGDYSRLSEAERVEIDRENDEVLSHTGSAHSHAHSQAPSHRSGIGIPVAGAAHAGPVPGGIAGIASNQRLFNRPPSMVGAHTAARAASVIGMPTSRPASMAAPQIRVPTSDIPRNIPNFVLEDLKKSMDAHFAARTATMDKKLADMRADVTGVTQQVAELAANGVSSSGGGGGGASDALASELPGLVQLTRQNAEAIARLEQHSAELLARKVSVDQELVEVGSKLRALASASDKVAALERDVEGGRSRADDRMSRLEDKESTMQRQISNLVDMKAVEHLVGIRMAREVHELEERLTQTVKFATDKFESKLAAVEKQVNAGRSDALAHLKSEIMESVERMVSGGLRKSDLIPVQSAQTQLKDEVLQLVSSVERQDKKIQDAKLASSQLRDELAEAREELAKAIKTQNNRVASSVDEKTSQLSVSAQELHDKMDQQLATLTKKQRALEEAMAKVQQDAEARRDAKIAIERQYEQQEKQHLSKLAELRAVLEVKERQMESQRQELVAAIQKDSKRMGAAEGKNAVLSSLLAQERAEHEEKHELLRKARKEMGVVRHKMHDMESDAAKRLQKLSSELHAKQSQVSELTKKLHKSERESARLLENSMREAKAIRRLKATKEHELLLAKMKLGEMERVSLATEQDEAIAQVAAIAAANIEEAEARRQEMEQVLLASHLEIDSLRQELEFVAKEADMVKEQHQMNVDELIAKVSREYDDKINALNQQIVDKENAMQQLREADKGDLGGLEQALSELKDDKEALAESLQRAQHDHLRLLEESEASSRLIQEKELVNMQHAMEARAKELGDAQSALEASKDSIEALEKELEEQKAAYNDTVNQLTQEIKDARATIDSCSSEIITLKDTKLRLVSELAQAEAKVEGVAADKEHELDDVKAELENQVQRVRDELQTATEELADKEELLRQAKVSDEQSREQLVAMASNQTEMERRYLEQLDALSLTLKQERESSVTREQDMESTIALLTNEVKLLKTESVHAVESSRIEWMVQITELSENLKSSQSHEQKLQHRLQNIVKELSAAASVSLAAEDVSAEGGASNEDDAIVKQCLDTLYERQRRTAQELDKLQAEYEMAVTKATTDAAAAQSLETQVDGYVTQIHDLEQSVATLEQQLKDEYAKTAAVVKCSGDIEDEVSMLQQQKRDLESQVLAKEQEYDEIVASFQEQVDAKQQQVEELVETNSALTATIETVRQKMDAVEAEKAHELDELREQMLELEGRVDDLQTQATRRPEHERDYYANQKELLVLAQDVRACYQKLATSCGVLEWSDIRASVFSKEEETERLFLEKSRDLARIQSVEQEIMLNSDFLNALASDSTADEGDDAHRPLWLAKYAALAPEAVGKLQAIEVKLQNTMVLVQNEAAAATLGSADRNKVNGDLSAEETSLEAMADWNRDTKREVVDELDESIDRDVLADSGDSAIGQSADTQGEQSSSELSAATAQAPSSQTTDTRGEMLSTGLTGLDEDYFRVALAKLNESSQDTDEVEQLLMAQATEFRTDEEESSDEAPGALPLSAFEFEGRRPSGRRISHDMDDEDGEGEQLLAGSATSLKASAHDDDDEFGDDDFEVAAGNGRRTPTKTGSSAHAKAAGDDDNSEEYLEESFDLEESMQDDEDKAGK